MTEGDRDARPEVGLCARCIHATVKHSARGSEFWRCRAADEYEHLPRYPPLPVNRCAAFGPVCEPAGPGRRHRAEERPDIPRENPVASGRQRSGSGRPSTTKNDSRKL